MNKRFASLFTASVVALSGIFGSLSTNVIDIGFSVLARAETNAVSTRTLIGKTFSGTNGARGRSSYISFEEDSNNSIEMNLISEGVTFGVWESRSNDYDSETGILTIYNTTSASGYWYDFGDWAGILSPYSTNCSYNALTGVLRVDIRLADGREIFWGTFNELNFKPDDSSSSEEDSSEPEEENESAILKLNDLNCVVGETSYITGTYTAKKPSQIKNELGAVNISTKGTASLDVTLPNELFASDNKTATISMEVNPKTCGESTVTVDYPDSGLEPQSVNVFVEPKLVISDSANTITANIYNHYACATIDCTGTEDVITKDVAFNVDIDRSDRAFLTSFLNKIEVSTLDTNELTKGYASYESSYSIASDGKSAEFVVSISCPKTALDITDYISIKTPAQEKIIQVCRTFTHFIWSSGDVWQFKNGHTGKTSGSKEVNPLTQDDYLHIFNDSPAYASKLLKEDNGTDGICAGMVISAVSSSFYEKPVATSFVNKDGSNVKYLYDINDFYAKSGNITVDKYIQYAHIYQYTPEFGKKKEANKNNLNLLRNSIGNSLSLDKSDVHPIYISIRGKSGGHALLAVGIDDTDSTSSKIIVYDCNYPGVFKELILSKDSNGKYVSWYYEPLDWGTGKDGNYISFVPIDEGYINCIQNNGIQLSQDLNLVIAEDNLISASIGDNSFISYPIMSDSVLENGSVISKHNTYWVEGSEDITIENGNNKNTVTIASQNESIDVEVSPNGKMVANVNDDSDDNVSIYGLSLTEPFSISFEEYRIDTHNTITENQTIISGKANNEVKAINSDRWVEIFGATEIDVLTECDNENVDHVNIDTNGHSVKVLRDEKLDLDYLIDINDDGIYDICETIGHDWGEWVVTKEPSETEEGSETRTCKNDPSHTEARVIPKLTHTHTLVKTNAKSATCTEIGNIEYWTCSGCGRYFSDSDGNTEINAEDTVVEALGHEWDEGVVTKEPTATEEGEKTYTCKHDPTHTKTETIPATGETPVDITYTFSAAQTDWTKGSNENAEFTVNRSEEDDKTFDLFDHIEIDGETIDAANYEAAAGSLKLNLKAEFLETLSLGEHTLKAVFADGEAETKLVVAAAAVDPDDSSVPNDSDKDSSIPDDSDNDSSVPDDSGNDNSSSDDSDSSSSKGDSSSNGSSSSNGDSSNSNSSNNSNSSSSNTSSNNNGGSTASQSSTSTNNTTTNPDSTNNPKTGDAGTATKAFGLAALMLGVVTVLKKKKQ